MARVRVLAQRDYWDFPRSFVVRWHGRLLYFHSPFDRMRDDFAEDYSIYVLPKELKRMLAPPSSWTTFLERGEYLGTVAVERVLFDKTGLSIDDGVLQSLHLD